MKQQRNILWCNINTEKVKWPCDFFHVALILSLLIFSILIGSMEEVENWSVLILYQLQIWISKCDTCSVVLRENGVCASTLPPHPSLSLPLCVPRSACRIGCVRPAATEREGGVISQRLLPSHPFSLCLILFHSHSLTRSFRIRPLSLGLLSLSLINFLFSQSVCVFNPNLPFERVDFFPVEFRGNNSQVFPSKLQPATSCLTSCPTCLSPPSLYSSYLLRSLLPHPLSPTLKFVS